MAKHDLTGSLETKFTFSIEDKEFEFRKPTVREMRALAKKFAAIEALDDPEQQTEASDNAMKELYQFIKPINHDVDVQELLNEQPVGVQVAFNNMVKEELTS